MDFLQSMTDISRPEVRKREWMDQVTLALVTDEMLDDVVDACIAAGRYGLDLETTGLDNRVFDGRTRDQIVGFCLAPDEKTGYYVPVRHKEGEEHNLKIERVEAAIRRLVNSDSVAVFHNAKFDQEFLQFGGGEPMGTWDSQAEFEDTYLLAWLRNTRQNKINLKILSKEDLGWEMIELEELFGRKHDLDFSTLDPSWEPCVWYAASDAICTLKLFNVLHPQVVVPEGDRQKGQEVVYKLEKMCLPATRWMERCRVAIDRDKVAELMQLGQVEYFECMRDIYDFCNEKLAHKREQDRDEDGNLQPPSIEPGWFRLLRKRFKPGDPDYNINQQIEDCRGLAKRRNMDDVNAKGHYFQVEGSGFPTKYDILSRPQLGPLFQELEIPDLRTTEKSEQIQTTQAEIERLNDKYGNRYPFLPKIKRLGELQKALGTYLISMHNDCGPDETLRVNYNQCGTDTGRFTTPASKNPAADGGTKFPMHGAPATYDKQRPQCLLRIREAVRAREGKVMVAIDFGGVELRIATILSGEPKWLREYFRCSTCGHEFDSGDGVETPEAPPAYCPSCGDDRIGDLHTLTGVTFFGEDKVGTKQWKAMRQGAKCVHPDTLILDRYGLDRIGAAFEFGGEDEFLSVKDEEQIWNGNEFQVVKASYNGGSKKLFHVVTHRGIVTCSDQHRFQLKNGRLISIEKGLAKGMELVLPETPRLPVIKKWEQIEYRAGEDVPPTYIQLSGDFAYFAGLYVGDGTKDGARSVSLSHGHVSKTDVMGVPYKEWQDHLIEVCEGLGFRPVRRKKSVYLGSAKVIGFLRALGLVGEDEKRRLRVPDWVLQGGQTAALQFLGGLIDTDGTLDKEDAEPSITTKDAVFGGQLMALLRTLGFMPRMEPCWNKTYKRWYYRLHIRASQASRLRNVIRHRGKLARIRDPKPGTKKTIENRVLAIIPAGKQPCVDVSMKGCKHLYWCNGLITHNSANFAMAYGGGPSAILRAIEGCSQQEASRHHRAFQQTYRSLKAWWDQVKNFGRKHGYVKTAFGRRYPIPDIKLPVSPREVGKQLVEQYKAKLAQGKKVKAPTEADVKRQVEFNRKFRAKAERNATNGPIQGLSADITKLSMGLIYKECRKRGWLDKVYMIITIHDELVFEIDEDILVEAVELFQDIMTRNKTILGLRWPVPLTTDCEIGFDWTVPWDVKDFKYRRVRPDGLQVDEKGHLPRDRETGKLKAKLWPAKFVKLFGPVYGFAPVLDNPTEEEGRALFGNGWTPLPLDDTPQAPPAQPPGAQEGGVAAEEAQEAPQGRPEDRGGPVPPPQPAPAYAPAEASPAPPSPRLERGQTYEFRVRELGVGVAYRLAQAIVECRNTGTHPLRVVGPDGEDLLWEGADIMVSPHEFRAAAKFLGLMV